jgi:5-methylcytosine-specific restriction protein A
LDLTHFKGTITDIYSKEAVLAAIEEYDERGRTSFLAKYGFGQARKYFLETDGKLYDAHAVLGAAHGYEHPDRGPLGPGDFSAGQSVVAKLESLGFQVHAKA